MEKGKLFPDMSIPGCSFTMKPESLFWRLCFFCKKIKVHLQTPNTPEWRCAIYLESVCLSAAAVWALGHFSNKGNHQPETSVLRTLESETSRPVAMSTGCLCSDCSQMSSLDTRGQSWTVSVDQSQHSNQLRTA